MDKPNDDTDRLPDRAIGKIAGKISDATGSLTMEAIALLQKCGDHNRGAAVVLGIGGSYGPLQVLASVLGHAKNGDLSDAVTDDSILFAALLVICSCHTSKDPSDPGTIITAFEHDPMSFVKAASMFEQLTGRKADAFLDPMIVKGMNMDTNAGLEMLNQVCANRKPC